MLRPAFPLISFKDTKISWKVSFPSSPGRSVVLMKNLGKGKFSPKRKKTFFLLSFKSLPDKIVMFPFTGLFVWFLGFPSSCFLNHKRFFTISYSTTFYETLAAGISNDNLYLSQLFTNALFFGKYFWGFFPEFISIFIFCFFLNSLPGFSKWII